MNQTDGGDCNDQSDCMCDTYTYKQRLISREIKHMTDHMEVLYQGQLANINIYI